MEDSMVGDGPIASRTRSHSRLSFDSDHPDHEVAGTSAS